MRKLQLKRILDVKGFSEKVQKSLHEQKYGYLAILIYTIVLSTFTILKNQAFLTSGFDLGIFNQAFWTTTHDGMLFYETGDLSFNPGGSFFGVHFSPFLFLLVPFYSIWPGPEILLIMQSAICAIGAFPVFWMARDKLGKRAGAVLAVVYLFYPALIYMNLNEFHLEAFTSTLFLFSVYYLEKADWSKFFVFFVLSLSTIEFAPVIGVFVAVYGFILLAKRQLPRTKRTSIYLFVAALISVGFFILGITVKELLNPTTSAIPTPFHYLFSNPGDIFNVLSVQLDSKFLYLIYLFGPVAFLPFLAPEALVMALPWLCLSFVSNYNPYYSIFYFYSGFVIPFIFVALPKAISRFDSSKINGFYRSNKKRFLTLLILSTLVFSIYLPIVPDPTKSWNFTFPLNSPRNEDIQHLLSLIPSNASILTQNDIFPHVSSRADAYLYLPNSTEVSVDYILVDTKSIWYYWDQPDQFGDRIPLYDAVPTPSIPSNFAPIVVETSYGTYGVYAWVNDIVLYKKNYSDTPIEYNPRLGFNSENMLRLENGSKLKDASSVSGFILKSGVDNSGVLWFGPYVPLNPGLYKVAYTVKVENDNMDDSAPLFTVDVTHSSGQVTVAEKDVYKVSSNETWLNVNLIIKLTEPAQGVEFRGIGVKGHSVSLDYLVVEPLSPELFSSDALVGDAGKTVDGALVYAVDSYASLPKGSYTARFWLRLDEQFNGDVLQVSVTDSKTNSLIDNAEKTVSSTNLETGKWTYIDLSFELENDVNGVRFTGSNVEFEAPVSLLFIDVFNNTGEPLS
jgi:uncharacterized membrane protein